MITPAMVSDMINVPASTVRRWAARYAHHLSPQHGKKRMYTVSDVDTFRRIRDLSGQGYSLERIDQELGIVPEVQPDEKTAAMVSMSDFVESLESAHRTLAELKQQADTQSARIKALEEWILLPWWKKFIRRPPVD